MTSEKLAPDLANTTFLAQKQWIFDRWAPTYDWVLPSVFYQALHQRLLDYLVLPDNPHVLDLGCGTGKLLKRLLQAYPTLQGMGVDLSKVMLVEAQRACQGVRGAERLQFRQGNAQALPLESEQFDAVFNTISFLHYPDPAAVLGEVARVLKPGGRYYLVDFTQRWAEEPVVIGVRGGTIRFYSPQVRESLGQSVGLTCLAHHYLLGPVMLSVFQK